MQNLSVSSFIDRYCEGLHSLNRLITSDMLIEGLMKDFNEESSKVFVNSESIGCCDIVLASSVSFNKAYLYTFMVPIFRFSTVYVVRDAPA
ncbi:hypothetical protein AYI68_g4060 [Smittium mucronatum]|uniref:Uncharacterized protein n=1 Tax=Smittium mucronatum TaxID=133383 RepID=A0A1R0GY53_9FUNG|nr:hypothetical protein AYI68_g4060 [Smittium mucronatum]